MDANELELRRCILESKDPCEAARDYAKWLEGQGRLDDAARVLAAALAEGHPSFAGRDYEISFSELPAGTKLSLKSSASTASNQGYVSTKVDVSDQLGALSPRDAFDYRFKMNPNISVSLDFGGPRLAVDAPAVTPSHGIGDSFRKVADTPVRFGSEASARAEHSVAFFQSGLSPEILGPAQALRDIDWVALTSELPKRVGRICSGYRDTKDKRGPEKSYPLTLVDQKITVYERTTSKPVASKDFKAEDRCPMLTFGEQAKNYPSAEPIKQWLRELRAKR